VILKDDESDTPSPEATAEPSKPTDPSSHGPWCDIEDGGYVDDDLCPIPSLEQEGLASTPTPAQGQPHSLHLSPRPSQNQINQHGNDGTIRRTSEEPGPHSLSTPLLKSLIEPHSWKSNRRAQDGLLARSTVPTPNSGWDNLPVTLGIPEFWECWVTRPRCKLVLAERS
jgi:hypothetical protein